MFKDDRHNIPFQIIQWDNIAKEEHQGEHGTWFWQTVQMPGVRLRVVEYCGLRCRSLVQERSYCFTVLKVRL